MYVPEELADYWPILESIHRRCVDQARLKVDWGRFRVAALQAEPDLTFLALIQYLRREGSDRVLVLDWKAGPADVAFALHRALDARGIDDRWQSEIRTPAPSKAFIHEADVWLRRHDLRLVDFATDGDDAVFAPVSPDDAELLVRLGAGLGPQRFVVPPLITTVPDEWKFDETALPTEAGPLVEQPDRRTRALPVSSGAPGSWFVIYQDPPHPRAYGAHRFEGSFVSGELQGPSVPCHELDDALAFRDKEEALRRSRRRIERVMSVPGKIHVMTVDQARTAIES